MMQRFGMLLACAAMAFGSAACAAGMSRSAAEHPFEIGPATAPAVEREAALILERHGYDIVRRDEVQNRVTLETQWVHRDPYPAEAAAGVTQARSRFWVNTRPRSVSNSAGQVLSGVTLLMEVEQMMMGEQDWVPARHESPEARALAQRIANELRLELQVKGMNG